MAEEKENQAMETSEISVGPAALYEKLDELLEKYLGLLDEYQKRRKTLNECMSSVSACFRVLYCRTLRRRKGFLSLAQANFASSSRVRYGQDYYDGRMKALRTVHV